MIHKSSSYIFQKTGHKTEQKIFKKKKQIPTVFSTKPQPQLDRCAASQRTVTR